MFRAPVQGGFTLMELLVAIAIFAILAVMAYGGLENVLEISHHATAQVARLTNIQSAVSLLSQDLTQVIDRPVRDEYGDMRPSFLGGSARDNQEIEFTRGGRRNPLGFPRSSLQRIGYRLQEGRWLRLSWQVLDRAQDSKPISQIMVDHVDGLHFRFLDDAGTWHDQWPLDSTTLVNSTVARVLPKAVEVEIDFPDLGRITRLYPLY